eukprot:CAMPEP_0201680388 /NCGR_PEP_ID=MMETSP0494-20130426/50573_1 /ASSEMBLY_ACC=CAM_ASM_000839 /TAXON_ID=420259 /ORGANISM="Thalassiosira gravida, Strain GMp14c1" /LENGTH=757 /DNA_ID=CAMNT_0048164107 /DNA_START=106 /DNA_END=2379 /DNA_ORIENTATION=-
MQTKTEETIYLDGSRTIRKETTDENTGKRVVVTKTIPPVPPPPNEVEQGDEENAVNPGGVGATSASSGPISSSTPSNSNTDTPPSTNDNKNKMIMIGMLVAVAVAIIIALAVVFAPRGDDQTQEVGRKEDSLQTTGGGTTVLGEGIIDGVNTYIANYTVDLTMTADGCEITNGIQTPPMTITCPVGAILISPIDKCTVESETTIRCRRREEKVRVGCFGRAYEDMRLAIVTGAASYSCDAFIEEKVHLNLVVAQYGGSVTHSLSTFLGRDSEEEILVVLENGEIEGSCRARSSCSFVPICCTGEDVCLAEVPENNATVSLDSIAEDRISPFETELAPGDSCDYGPSCASNVCIGGICLDSKLVDGAGGCNSGVDCASGACAAPSMEEPASLVRSCCAEGTAALADDKGFVVCAGQPPGATCFDDSLCESGVCIFDTCREGVQEDEVPCQNAGHCRSGACGRWSTGEDVCCPTGDAMDYDGNSYCVELPADAPCIQDGMCEGEVCGVQAWTAASSHVCCPANTAISADRPDNSYYSETYCTGLTLFQACGNDDMCENAACGGATYVDDAPTICCPGSATVYLDTPGSSVRSAYYCTGLSAGEACSTNEMCVSDVCVDNVCMEDAQDSLEPCDEDEDCSGLACGLQTWTATSSRVCCPTNTTVDSDRPDSSYYSETYCTGQATFDPCGSDDMCETAACGQATYVDDAPTICCPGSATVYLDTPGSSVRSAYYCTGLSVDEACGSNEMCESLSCVDESCS